jgi:Tol biopolymer transport system component
MTWMYPFGLHWTKSYWNLSSLLILIFFLAGCDSQPISPTDLKSSDPRPGIAFTSDRSGNWDIYLIQPDGSGLTQLTDDPSVDSDPDWSPDGRQIAFRSRQDGSSDIFVMGSDGSAPFNLIKDPETSLDDEFAPRWNPDGETFSIYTDRFPPQETCDGGFHQIALLRVQDGRYEIDRFETIAGEQYSSAWSPDGRYLAFNSKCRIPGFQIYIYDTQTGDTHKLTSNEPNSNSGPAWSHNGQFLAFSTNINNNSDIYVLDLKTNNWVRITDHPAKDIMPSWSPDDSQIAFVSDRTGNDEIFIIDVDGSNLYNLTQNPADDWYPDWSPIARANP